MSWQDIENEMKILDKWIFVLRIGVYIQIICIIAWVSLYLYVGF